jgi:hypothetical protein
VIGKNSLFRMIVHDESDDKIQLYTTYLCWMKGLDEELNEENFHGRWYKTWLCYAATPQRQSDFRRADAILGKTRQDRAEQTLASQALTISKMLIGIGCIKGNPYNALDPG